MSTNVALQKAEDDALAEILSWVQEVVEGRGDSAAQMIVTVVLGCIPYVGQAVDVYNILRCIYGLTKAPSSTESWIALVLALIAIVPLFGDALKNVFMMMRNGKKMGRILDSLPNKVRGNIEKWFRELNWVQYARELSRSVDDIFAGMIDVLEYRVTKWVLGREGVQKLIQQLRNLKQMAARKINEAMDSLRQMHQRALQDPLPSTSGHTPALPKPKAGARPTPGTQAPTSVPKNTSGTPTPASGQASGTKRQSQRSTQSKHKIGVSGEHIADYYYVRRQHTRKKVSHGGHLYEMTQPNGNGKTAFGHHGIDHVWHSSKLPHGYRVSDTKGSGKPFHRTLETAQAVWQALEYGIDAYLGEEDEKKARGAVNSRTTLDGKQMSHRWIAAKIGSAALTTKAEDDLTDGIEAWRRSGFQLGMESSRQDGVRQRALVRCPYDRSLITVVGPNHKKHENATGSTTGKCQKTVASHQIGTEFVLPNTLLLE
jgi:hypothetical protein